ncbi:hypothetical protein [Acinetobacter sp. ANC 3903]|uniref:hypothetical protein n=1 Tax=Acinetobacter sp. ANC 3903 TaxID=1977883 RepID=UPI00148A848C|nr:hypothetical protein [Acinetobacter sp. ANC 3903]
MTLQNATVKALKLKSPSHDGLFYVLNKCTGIKMSFETGLKNKVMQNIGRHKHAQYKKQA